MVPEGAAAGDGSGQGAGSCLTACSLARRRRKGPLWPTAEHPPPQHSNAHPHRLMLQEADPVWSQAQAQLQEAVRNPKGSNQYTSGGSPRRGEADPTVGKNGCPKDRKSRLIRTLTNLKADPVPAVG